MTRQQISLLGIISLFAAPLILAVLMRSSWWGYQPAELKNLGLMVQPTVQIALKSNGLDTDNHQTEAIRGKWLMLYLMPENCTQECTDAITTLRQIHKSMGRQNQHISIVILSENEASSALQLKVESIYQELNFISEPPVETLMILARVNADLRSGQDTPGNFRTFIVDPMLNVVLAYGDDSRPGDLQKDLKRLAKWSRQDK
jgi:peroxiredoxin